MSGARISIPSNVRRTIENIKEMTGNNHTEDDIYAMLKDCSMDPNETAQKLLLQDPFHEVKRKRDRKKETPNKEPAEPKWRPGMQGRGNRGGRLNYPSRRVSNDGRASVSAKENGMSKVADDGPKHSTHQGHKNKERVVKSSSRPVPDENKSEVLSVVEASKSPVGGSVRGPLNEPSASKTPSPSEGLYLSAKDPILIPSQGSRFPVGTIKREVGSQQTSVDVIHETSLEIESIAPGSEVGNSSMQAKASSSHVSFPVARPSSNYNNRPQQAIGPQKVGPSMEWKPKPTNPVLAHGTGSTESPKMPVVQDESQTSNPFAARDFDLKEATQGLEKKLEESQISDNQHVIIPNHLHVPEAEKLGFYFGSFDASFSLNPISSNGPGIEPKLMSDKSSEASEVVDESIDEQLRNQNDALATVEVEDHLDRPPSSNNIPENLSTEGDTSSIPGPDQHESKQETSLPTASHQYPILHTSPNFSFGFIPPMIGTHVTSFEPNESHSHDGSQVPNFVVQQPFDPASYYAQFYRSGADMDGRVSPFHSTGVPNKFNANIPVLSPQASHSSQEVGNSLMFSGAGPTPTATTQTGGFMQTSIPVTQQPLPVFRQPPGIHLLHYPPNYIPYAPYFSPFYVPPPAIHQFLSNNTFPQQPQPGSMYPGPPVPSPKYPLPQYKTGGNTGNQVNIGMPGSYGTYGLNPAGYNSGSAATAGNSTSDEDLGGSQFKESNVYITGQQSEGSGVWMAAPGRDMSGVQANSFYNIPQGGHGTFASIYHHPAQPVTTSAVHPLLQQSQILAGPGVDMAGPTPQINWPNNY
ncbi:GBF-interacting protein 1-like [Bidens hawaiensis]|uniref:GBF-interacting protein 1-like n=1 Tax=Bidens hawaiensis TaxID=980011 RepID=UPI00404AB741